MGEGSVDFVAAYMLPRKTSFCYIQPFNFFSKYLQRNFKSQNVIIRIHSVMYKS